MQEDWIVRIVRLILQQTPGGKFKERLMRYIMKK